MTAEEAKEALLRAAENYVVVGSGAELLQAAVEYAEAVRGECVWNRSEYGDIVGYYKTTCGAGILTTDIPNYCPRCEKKVRVE